MIKNYLAYALCMMLAVSMTGCGSKDSDKSVLEQQAIIPAATESAGEQEIPEGAITDESGTFYYAGPLQQFGDSQDGYIQLPLGFAPFQAEGVENAEGVTQYTNASGTNLVTLDRYNVDYATSATTLRYYMEEDENVEGLTGASVKINGYTALQIYCHYKADNTFMVAWCIEDPADPKSSYYLAIQFTNEDSAVMACSSTFQTVDDFTGLE